MAKNIKQGQKPTDKVEENIHNLYYKEPIFLIYKEHLKIEG